MSSDAEKLALLRLPFPAEDVRWRITESGGEGKDTWGRCVAYITSRAVIDRLDDVMGPANWRNEFAAGPAGGIMCGISILIDGAWVTKWDGADNSDIEAVKGGFSDAMKRAAVHWGIGRYLYELPGGRAKIHDKGAHRAKRKGGGSFNWDDPGLPFWALPGGTGRLPQVNGNGQSAQNGAGKKPPGKVDKPGSEVDVAAQALAKIVNAHTEVDLDRYLLHVDLRAKEGKLKPEQVKPLKEAGEKRREKIRGPGVPA